MAAAVPLDSHDYSLAEARLCWNRTLHVRHAHASACREARQLSLQMAAQLHAQLSNCSADLRSLARSLHIPLPSLRHLLALADSAPAPPALTLTGCDFSLRLDPPQWALARRSLELLTRPGQPPFDLSHCIADAFTSQTSGPLRDQLRQLHRAHPLDFIPDRVAALPPVSVPAPSTRSPGTGSWGPRDGASISGWRGAAAPGPAPNNARVAALPPLSLPATPSRREPPPPPAVEPGIVHSWSRLQALRRSRRFACRELAELSPRLARLIFVHWRIYAQPGRSSAFSAWLHMAGIPRSSAYRLLRQFHPYEGDFASIPPLAQDLNCPENAPASGTRGFAVLGPAPIEATLHQGKLLARLSPQHATIVHCALSGLLAQHRPFNPAPIVVGHLASCVPPADRASLDSLYRSPPTQFQRFLPPLRLYTPASPA